MFKPGDIILGLSTLNIDVMFLVIEQEHKSIAKIYNLTNFGDEYIPYIIPIYSTDLLLTNIFREEYV